MKKKAGMRKAVWVLFFIYFAILIKVILFKYGRGMISSVIQVWDFDSVVQHIHTANFIPFRYIANSYRAGGWEARLLMLNTIAFVPLGIFYGILGRRTNLLKALGVGVVVSFSFEFIQLVTLIGEYDADDIVLNTFGTLIGYIFIAVIQLILRLFRSGK